MPSPHLSSHPIEHDNDSITSDDHEVHKDGDVEIKVTQAPGYLCHIKATAKFCLPPDKLFRQIITHPHNEKIFRHMDRCSYRKVLKDDGDGRQEIEVAHEASWKFLIFGGTFTTNLVVEQDNQQRLMKFSLKPESGGIMKKFVGWWQVDSYPEDPNACMTYLEQDLALGIYMPPPFDRILKGISCSQVRKIMEDVKLEVEKVNSGHATLEDWEKVQLTEIGVENGRQFL